MSATILSSDSSASLVESVGDMVSDNLPAATTTTTTTAITTTLLPSAFATFFAFSLALWLLRVVILKSLVWLGRTHYAETLRITRKPVITDKQLEREGIWIYGYGYDTVAMALIYYFGWLNDLPAADNLVRCLLWSAVWHALLVEPIYYAFHRMLHWQWFYKNFHQYHHKSIHTEPTTGVSFEIFERLSYTVLFAVAPLLVDWQGYQSYAGFLLYVVWFDVMNEGGHINFEVVPRWLLQSPAKYLLYSPTFHSVHHTKFKKNYSLFMPYTDLLFGTAIYSDVHNNKSGALLPVTMPAANSSAGKDFVLLVHGANIESMLYSQYLHPLLKFKNKFEHKFYMYLFYPYLWLLSLYCSVDPVGWHREEDQIDFTCPKPSSSASPAALPHKDEMQGATWTIRSMAAMYVMPSFHKQINGRIERAILQAAREGVRVVALGNFNKAEWINHGGSDLVANLGDRLNGTKISHGDTLSAAVVYQYAMALRQAGYWSRGVFVTGSTSKIGRAVVLSLAAQGVCVVMYTQVKARFDEIAAEAGSDRGNLVCSHDLADGKSCDLWLTGKMIPHGSQLLNALPTGATVVNFSVPDPLTPKLMRLRPDLLHLDTGLLAYSPKAMTPRFTWLLPQGMVYACLAGGIVHAALGIEAHEVGPVVVADMDKYWNAALTLGFSLPAPSSFYSPITMPLPGNHKKMSVITV